MVFSTVVFLRLALWCLFSWITRQRGGEGRGGRESDCFLGIEERGRGTEKESDLFSLPKSKREGGREREREREREMGG